MGFPDMPAESADAISAVAELARQVRGTTQQLIGVPAPDWLTWTPAGTSNHLLWHAGHAVWLQDALGIESITGRSELPRGWAEIFGMNSRPAAISSWPDVAEVRAQLQAQLTRYLDLISSEAETIVARANKRSPSGGWPLLPGMIHGWYDEAKHQGEMYLLHKLRRAHSRAGD
jgi:hypothetical protein